MSPKTPRLHPVAGRDVRPAAPKIRPAPRHRSSFTVQRSSPSSACSRGQSTPGYLRLNSAGQRNGYGTAECHAGAASVRARLGFRAGQRKGQHIGGVQAGLHGSSPHFVGKVDAADLAGQDQAFSGQGFYLQRRAIKCYCKAAHVKAYLFGAEFQHPAAARVSRLLPRNSKFPAGDKRRRAAEQTDPPERAAVWRERFLVSLRSFIGVPSFAKSPNFSNNIRGGLRVMNHLLRRPVVGNGGVGPCFAWGC